MNKVLVLSKSWTPINVLNALDAIHKVINGRADCIDVESRGIYDFESWVDNWSDAKKTAQIATDRIISSGGFSIVIPDVIVCTEYRGFGYKMMTGEMKFSRANVYRRDRNICQFCGKKFPTEELTMDHIIPKSKGGPMSWTNIVLACTSCNHKKSNKSLKESGLKLIRKPFVPMANDLKRSPIESILHKVGNKPPKTWKQFIEKLVSNMYWQVELQE